MRYAQVDARSNARLDYHERQYQLRHAEASTAFAVEQYDGIGFLESFEDVWSELPDLQYLVTVGDEELWYDDRIFRFEDLVSSGEGRRNAESPAAGDDSDLAMLYTSCTMGGPKGVRLSHDRVALRSLEAERGTIVDDIPTFHLLMRDATYNPSRLRTLQSGSIAGGSVSEDLACRVREWGVPAEIRRSLTPEGFCLTGDPGIIDENGYVRIVGRRRETILRGGYRISPREVEDQLRAHPAVDDVCVIGVPHDTVGELVCACVVPVEGAVITDKEVKDFARDTVADYKVPTPSS